MFNEFMRWQAGWWQTRDQLVTDDALQEGLRAYANHQAALREALHSHAQYLWQFCNGWEAKRQAPTDIRWFVNIIRPSHAPWSSFVGDFRNDLSEVSEPDNDPLTDPEEGW